MNEREHEEERLREEQRLRDEQDAADQREAMREEEDRRRDAWLETFIEALDDEGDGPYEYSGRGMNGATCVGIDLADSGLLFDVGMAVMLALTDNHPGVNTQYLFRVITTPRVDSMGRGIVAYWPNIPWREEWS